MAPLVEDAVKFATGNGGLTLIVVALEDEPNELETVENYRVSPGTAVCINRVLARTAPSVTEIP